MKDMKEEVRKERKGLLTKIFLYQLTQLTLKYSFENVAITEKTGQVTHSRVGGHSPDPNSVVGIGFQSSHS